MPKLFEKIFVVSLNIMCQNTIKVLVVHTTLGGVCRDIYASDFISFF